MLTGLASEEDRDGLFIVSFNMVEEVFRKMQLPELIRIPKDYERAITVFNGCLSFIFYQRPNTVEIWVMEDYGNEESWTRTFTIGLIKLMGIFGECSTPSE